jgi:hypothetical protein
MEGLARQTFYGANPNFPVFPMIVQLRLFNERVNRISEHSNCFASTGEDQARRSGNHSICRHKSSDHKDGFEDMLGVAALLVGRTDRFR